MTRMLSRRRLIEMVAATGLGLIAAACRRQPVPEPLAAATVPLTSPSPSSPPAPAMPTPTQEAPAQGAPPAATATPQQTAPTLAAAPTSAPPPYLVAVHGDDPEAITRRALAELGGMERFVSPGYDVIIKPNICNANHTYEYASTTNPTVVATLVRLCLEAGAARVRVMDNPFAGSGEQAYLRSGIREAVEAAGGEMEVMAPHRFVESDIPLGLDLKSWLFYQPILDADLVINVPIAKHHGLARLTLGGKNIMGCIENRSAMHRNLGQRIADLVSRVAPQLTIMDAVRILVANGPTGGSLEDVRVTNTVIASQDLVAVDAYTTRLFDMQPDDIAYITAAHNMGLGTMLLADLDIAELEL